MTERQEIEELLTLVEAEKGRWSPHVPPDTLVNLCRAWLAVDGALEVDVREVTFLDGHRIGEIIATVDASLIDQRVRIVLDAWSSDALT